MHGLALALLLVSAISVLASQPSALKPQEAPLRDLERGQLNILHTTDTHGWHAGHLQEAAYGADWGDYVDFARCLREDIEREGNDLLVVDTGDRIEGNGLYDASEPKGKYTFKILPTQHIDLICTGNHELYHRNSSEDEYLITVPAFKGAYIASNLKIQDPKTGDFVPFGPLYKKFRTKKRGINIMAFGFLFDFVSNYKNTLVQPVELAIKESWFQEAIRDRDVDLFLVIGHAPLRGPEFEAIFKEIRRQQWDTPIQFLGGHWHIRDYRKFDSKAYGLASGRYLETVGFQSIDGLALDQQSKAFASPKFFRRYIDNNLFSFYHHSHRNASTFHSQQGRKVSRAIQTARKKLNLDERFGCATRDLWMNRAPYPSNGSIFSWLEEKVMPDVIKDDTRGDIPRVAITNTGGIRFDIFKGPFTRDAVYTLIPFTSGFRYIANVDLGIARKLLPLLNTETPVFSSQSMSQALSTLAPIEQLFRLDDLTVASGAFADSDHQHTLGKGPRLYPGYTTKDDAGNEGDDTVHSPLSFYRVPNCIQSIIGVANMSEEHAKVDVVYNEFLEPWMLLAFRFLGLEFAKNDTAPYMEGADFTSLLADWIKKNWDNDC